MNYGAQSSEVPCLEWKSLDQKKQMPLALVLDGDNLCAVVCLEIARTLLQKCYDEGFYVFNKQSLVRCSFHFNLNTQNQTVHKNVQ